MNQYCGPLRGLCLVLFNNQKQSSISEPQPRVCDSATLDNNILSCLLNSEMALNSETTTKSIGEPLASEKKF